MNKEAWNRFWGAKNGRKPHVKVTFFHTNTYTVFKRRHELEINYERYNRIIRAVNEKIVDRIIDGDKIKLPHRLGTIYIIRYKQKLILDEEGNVKNKNRRRLVNYKETFNLWLEHPELEHKQYVYYENEHTNGDKFRIIWKRGRRKNINFYIFSPARTFKRKLAEYIFNHPDKEYYNE